MLLVVTGSRGAVFCRHLQKSLCNKRKKKLKPGGTRQKQPKRGKVLRFSHCLDVQRSHFVMLVFSLFYFVSAEAEQQLEAARSASESAEMEAGASQAELGMFRSQLQAANSRHEGEQAQASKDLAQAVARHSAAEGGAAAERAKVEDLSAQIGTLTAQLAASSGSKDTETTELRAAATVAQTELTAALEAAHASTAEAAARAVELQAAEVIVGRLQSEIVALGEKAASADEAAHAAERAAKAATAEADQATADRAGAVAELDSAKQALQAAEGAAAQAVSELEALKQMKSAPAAPAALAVPPPSGSGFPGEAELDGAPTRAQLNETIELAQKLLVNQTEVCEVENQANASLHAALGDVTQQLKDAEAIGARWEAATHASTELLQHYGTARRHEDGHEDASSEEVAQHAAYLGFDLHAHPELLWLAEEASEAPVPAGWAAHTDAEGQVFYYSTEKRDGSPPPSTYDHPLDEHYRMLYAIMSGVPSAAPGGGASV